MRSKLLTGAAALVVAACTVATTVDTASAAPLHRGWGWPGAVAAGVIGGAVAAATSPLWAPGYYDYYPSYGPGYGYPQGPAVLQGGDNVAACEARFRSYNPQTGTYMGFDGIQHPCP